MTAIFQLAWLTILESRRKWTFVVGLLISCFMLAAISTLTILVEREARREDAEREAAAAQKPRSATPNDPKLDGQDVERMRRRGGLPSGTRKSMADEAIRIGGMWIVRTFATIMAILLTAGAIAPERESGTILTILTKPIRRSSVLVGKWLGLNALLVGYLLILGLVICAILWVRTGAFPFKVFGASLVSAFFPMLFISLVLPFSVLTSAWVALGIGFFAWGVGGQEYGVLRAIAMGIRSVGYSTAGDILDAACKLGGFLVPTGRIGLWVDRMGGGLEFMMIPTPIPKPTATYWDLAYVVAYLAVLVFLTTWVFRRRDV